MKEIKFRAWLKKEKIISDVRAIWFGDKTVYVRFTQATKIKPITVRIEEERKFDEVELMQFTGLFDKNGKEIYEGDVVKVKELKEDALIVKWDEKRGAFFLENAFSNWWWFTYMGDYDVEVIGNIYENTELLEE